MSEGNRVSIIDIDMPFSSMVWFMVKWSIASIPAVIIISLIMTMVASFAVVGMGGLAAILEGIK